MILQGRYKLQINNSLTLPLVKSVHKGIEIFFTIGEISSQRHRNIELIGYKNLENFANEIKQT